MENTKKIKRTAAILFVAVILILLWYIINVVRGIVIIREPNVSIIITTLIILSILTLALILLFSIKKDESPFNLKNVKLLKAIALLLVAKESWSFIVGWINFGNILGASVTSVEWVIAAGLVVYCIALVFQHGITLQKQSDETL